MAILYFSNLSFTLCCFLLSARGLDQVYFVIRNKFSLRLCFDQYLCSVENHALSGAVLATGAISIPRGCLAMKYREAGLGVTAGGGVEAKDSPGHPATHRTATTKTDLPKCHDVPTVA